MTEVERFWSKVDKRGDDECWPWKAGKSRGYGWFHRVENGRLRGVKASQYMLELTLGRKPTLFVLHSCDNPTCVNPAHLREGTHAENVQDRVDRGRGYSGDDHHSAKLCHELVDLIREFYADGTMTVYEMAARCGVYPLTIENAALGKSWRRKPETNMSQNPREQRETRQGGSGGSNRND